MQRPLTILAFVLISAAGCLASCTNDAPEVAGVTSTVVFDYSSNESLPDQWLSVFAEVGSDARLGASVTARNIDTGLVWKCKSPRKIASSKKTWVGYTKLAPAEGESIPAGKWTFTYEDASEREVESNFNISYPVYLLQAKVSDYPDVIKVSKSEKIAVYTEDGLLCYYGERKKEWKTDKDITRTYKDAISVRKCYSMSNDKIVCIMPPENLKEADSNKAN